MTTITSNNTDLDLSSLQLTGTQSRQAKKQLGQEDFLALMIQQLKNQDPLKPMENGEFIGQMAQFSTVSGIADMSKSIGGLTDAFNSGQALQAASMVGRTVLTEANAAKYSGSAPVQGAVELASSSANAVVRVYSQAGALVRELPLGSQQAGLTNFTWDGTLANGQKAPAGTYRFTAAIENPAGATALTTYLASKVESVTLSGDGSGSQIRTDGGASVRLSQVKAVM
ncbi:MAG: flagellar hook assembly protein FlgD [Gammaproteobacteria bacterium]|nr:flagellar hook assembly protein FlgD [Gammaproteobacteria bacterium]